jgi:hypothetical protein
MPYSNGDSPVSRRELSLHLQPIKDDISEIRGDVSEIRIALGAGPRWMGDRMNAIIDKFLPAALALAALWVFTGRVGS